MSSKSLNLRQEEMLCEKVREYPVLYDKSHKGYKEKVAVENGWNEVAASLEFIENGKCFYFYFFLFSFNIDNNLKNHFYARTVFYILCSYSIQK